MVQRKRVNSLKSAANLEMLNAPISLITWFGEFAYPKTCDRSFTSGRQVFILTHNGLSAQSCLPSFNLRHNRLVPFFNLTFKHEMGILIVPFKL